MSFELRLLRDDDYEKLFAWWKWFRFPAPPKDYLPEDGKGGLMISKNGVDIVAGFLFLNNSRICWMEYIISNPEYRETDRHEAIGFLIDKLCYVAKQRGYKAVFTSLKHENLIKRYEAIGFSKGSGQTTEMTIVL